MSDGGRTLVAGVDSSTQSTKVVVCDADTGEVLRQARGLGRGRAGQGGLPRAGWDRPLPVMLSAVCSRR